MISQDGSSVLWSYAFDVVIAYCAYDDFTAPAYQLLVTTVADSTNLFGNAEAQGGAWLDGTTYVWMKQSGSHTFLLNPSTSPQRFLDDCGAFTYQLIEASNTVAGTAVLTTSGPNTHELTIHTDNVGFGDPDANIQLTFRITNDFGLRNFATASIHIRGCTADFEPYNTVEIQYQLGDADIGLQWIAAKYSATQGHCQLDTYEFISCDGPYMDATGDLTDPNN